MPSFGELRAQAHICAFLDEAVMTSQSRLAVVIHVFMSKHQFFVFAKVSRIHTLICTCVRTCRCIFKIRVYNNSTEQLLKLPYSVSVNTTSSYLLYSDNLDWLSRATNWAKFTATASLGVIHRGHEKEALHLMSTYLPKESGPGSAYSEGGGLYALGE